METQNKKCTFLIDRVNFKSKMSFDFSPPSPRVDGRPLDKDTTIKIDGKNVNIDADDLESMCILGRGAYGVVEKVRHIKTGTILAVKVS